MTTAMYEDFYARQQAQLAEAEGQRMCPPDGLIYGIFKPFPDWGDEEEKK